mgnify:CR=1 FL=1
MFLLWEEPVEVRGGVVSGFPMQNPLIPMPHLSIPMQTSWFPMQNLWVPVPKPMESYATAIDYGVRPIGSKTLLGDVSGTYRKPMRNLCITLAKGVGILCQDLGKRRIARSVTISALKRLSKSIRRHLLGNAGAKSTKKVGLELCSGPKSAESKLSPAPYKPC